METASPNTGRVLHNLNIDLICANSSQAKGRVERANKTLQDRLVKELRLADISNMDDGNAFLPSAISTCVDILYFHRITYCSMKQRWELRKFDEPTYYPVSKSMMNGSI